MQHHIHIMGIGGIGMSGIARVLSHKGYAVSGCDAQPNQTSKSLNDNGIVTADHHNSTLCTADNIDLIVHSTAISSDHPELNNAQKHNIPVYRRSDILPLITQDMFVIAVSGTHGKTTTTAIIGHILTYAGLDPTVMVGGHVRDFKSNVRLGSSNILVIEADESDTSLLQIKPDIALITNIDYDHTQTYSGIQETISVFKQFIDGMPHNGQLYTCADDTKTAQVCSDYTVAGTYGFDTTAAYHCSTYDANYIYASINNTRASLYNPLYGQHNIRNVLGAVAIADACNIHRDTIQDALTHFSGIARRCELRQYITSVPLYDDYAHHPAEIQETLNMLLEQGFTRPLVIFQPHRYSRFSSFWHDFLASFTPLQHGTIIVPDMYAAGETPIPGISSHAFASELCKQHPHLHVMHAPTPYMSYLTTYVHTNISYYDVGITLGAGDITHLHTHL